jgi:hypothetical protein
MVIAISRDRFLAAHQCMAYQPIFFLHNKRTGNDKDLNK